MILCTKLSFLLINKVFTMILKSYYSNIKKIKTEYYILSNNNSKIKYFLKPITYSYLSLNY